MTTILIEDDFSWKIKLQIMLDEIGITILGVATNVAETQALLKKYKPDIIVADILLNDERVFDAFKEDIKYYNIPVIFITQSDKEIDYKIAQKHKKHLYVVKPIHKLTLKSAINHLFGNNSTPLTQTPSSLSLKGRFNQKIELPFEKIVYIEQNQHYCTIHTGQQEFVQKKSLINLMKELDDRFMQIHRSLCININYIENFGVGLESLKIKSIELPIGLTYKDAIKKLISEKYSVK